MMRIERNEAMKTRDEMEKHFNRAKRLVTEIESNLKEEIWSNKITGERAV